MSAPAWATATETVHQYRYDPAAQRHRLVVGTLPVDDGGSAEIRVEQTERPDGTVELAVAVVAITDAPDVHDVAALMTVLLGLGQDHDDQEEPMQDTIMTTDTDTRAGADARVAAADAVHAVTRLQLDVMDLAADLEEARRTIDDLVGSATHVQRRPGRTTITVDTTAWDHARMVSGALTAP